MKTYNDPIQPPQSPPPLQFEDIKPGEVFEKRIGNGAWHGPYMKIMNWNGEPLMSYINGLLGDRHISIVDLTTGWCYTQNPIPGGTSFRIIDARLEKMS